MKMKFTNKMLPIVLVLLVVVVFSRCSTNGPIQEELEKYAKEMNDTYPIILADKVTRLDSCAALANKTLRYIYTTSVDRSVFDTVYVKAEMTPYFIQTIKIDPGTAFFRKSNVVFQYYYQDVTKNYIFLINITPQDYNN